MPDPICGDPWPLGGGDWCELKRGHDGPHKTATSQWPNKSRESRKYEVRTICIERVVELGKDNRVVQSWDFKSRSAALKFIAEMQEMDGENG